MNVYIQQKYKQEAIFGKNHHHFIISKFDELPESEASTGNKNIIEFIDGKVSDSSDENKDKLDTFQPILDFPNFLLIVLKLTRRIEEPDFDPTDFILDDKELIQEFDKLGNNIDEEFVKTFGYNLLKARYFLDNYLVHHSNEDDSIGNNSWKLQYWYKEGSNEYLKNLDGESEFQNKLVQLLSMFEVSFTARQRKNYLFYCLIHLFKEGNDIEKYCRFVNRLADKYFIDIYLDKNNLNAINTPNPSSFDSTILCSNILDLEPRNLNINFTAIYGDGSIKSAGVPLFVFNYLDYKLWEKYFDELRGEGTKESSEERKNFLRRV